MGNPTETSPEMRKYNHWKQNWLACQAWIQSVRP